tara:strand:- start:180 stop:338 length:159 start_codon:yes stop_codon:yes gene_type:complete
MQEKIINKHKILMLTLILFQKIKRIDVTAINTFCGEYKTAKIFISEKLTIFF